MCVHAYLYMYCVQTVHVCLWMIGECVCIHISLCVCVCTRMNIWLKPHQHSLSHRHSCTRQQQGELGFPLLVSTCVFLPVCVIITKVLFTVKLMCGWSFVYLLMNISKITVTMANQNFKWPVVKNRPYTNFKNNVQILAPP